jgi:hypothetical protein
MLLPKNMVLMCHNFYLPAIDEIDLAEITQSPIRESR